MNHPLTPSASLLPGLSVDRRVECSSLCARGVFNAARGKESTARRSRSSTRCYAERKLNSRSPPRAVVSPAAGAVLERFENHARGDFSLSSSCECVPFCCAEDILFNSWSFERAVSQFSELRAVQLSNLHERVVSQFFENVGGSKVNARPFDFSISLRRFD